MLWYCTILWIRSPLPKKPFPAYTRFFVLMVFGCGVAYVLGNWGVARATVRQLYQPYLLGLLTLAYCTNGERVKPIFSIYFGHFLWFGIWGLISLKLSPLTADVDPAARDIVFWHPSYDNRDAFGPLMVAGLAYSIYFYHANRAIRTRGRKLWFFANVILTTLGFVTSFGRGAFVGLLATAGSMWAKSSRKVYALVTVTLLVVGFSVAFPNLASRYLESMQTITGQGMQSGTGADRSELWGIAWREFCWSPIVGVGTNNYGIASQRVVGADEVMPHGHTRAVLWGRNVHSAPMTILSEYGLIGVVVALLLVVDFFRTNKRTRSHARLRDAENSPEPGFAPGYVESIALGLHAVFLTFCISGIFYELIYTPLYWTIIVLNRMLYFASNAAAAYEAAVHVDPTKP